MSEIKNCPSCKSENIYPSEELYICADCFYEWNPAEMSESTENNKVLDSNGNELHDGDSVTVIKDLPVKGAPKSIKIGTKAKNIKLVDGDHNILCKIDGFGTMYLKSDFVKKA
jgi:protein PhnA